MIKEYWNVTVWEPFLAITWEPDFSQACNFCGMLMNHKNFHVTQISDKANDMIFLKNPKTIFLRHFGPFLADGDFFQKNLAVTHKYTWASKSRLSFRKNYWANCEKTTEGWTEGRMDKPYFIEPFWPRPEAQ